MFEFTLPLEKNTKFLEIIALLYCFLEKSKRQLGTFMQKKLPFLFGHTVKENIEGQNFFVKSICNPLYLFHSIFLF